MDTLGADAGFFRRILVTLIAATIATGILGGLILETIPGAAVHDDRGGQRVDDHLALNGRP